MTKTNILVVEDDENIQQLVEYNLLKEGYETACVTSGEEALSVARSILPSLVVLDLMLPGVNGLEVCKTLKGDPKTQQLYVSDLLTIAERDRYLFVVWGLGIDCDAIADKAPPGLSDFIHFLKNNGFVDQKFNAKPSLDVWVSQLRRNPPKK